jgi:hypothetical protein
MQNLTSLVYSFLLKANDFSSYWPKIDDAIRHAIFDRRLHVRLLMSNWQSTRPELFSYLHSLRILNSQLPCIGHYDSKSKSRKVNVPADCLSSVHKFICKNGTQGSIEIKLFEVPPYKVKIPYSRVNHAK